jgi:hypothetical protein
MYEAGLFYPPFKHFHVRCPVRGFVEATFAHACKVEKAYSKEFKNMPDWIIKNPNHPVVIEYEFDDLTPRGETVSMPKFRSLMSLGEGEAAIPWTLLTKTPEKLCNMMNLFIYKILIVLLATKNCDRKTVENTIRANSKKARDDAKHYSTTTYISIGRITETCRHESGSRSSVRPHLRRGHLRRQKHGEGRQEVKTIFIPPIFVNADREWITDRKKYKLVA